MSTEKIQILLVEDEEAHAELVLLGFESRPEVSVTVALRLDQARSRLAESLPDLMIVDSLLPDGEGIELLAAADEPRCPVILLTSHGDSDCEAKALAAGAARYVVKSEQTLIEMPEIADSVLAEQRTRPEQDPSPTCPKGGQRIRTGLERATVQPILR